MAEIKKPIKITRLTKPKKGTACGIPPSAGEKGKKPRETHKWDEYSDSSDSSEKDKVIGNEWRDKNDEVRKGIHDLSESSKIEGHPQISYCKRNEESDNDGEDKEKRKMTNKANKGTIADEK